MLKTPECNMIIGEAPKHGLGKVKLLGVAPLRGCTAYTFERSGNGEKPKLHRKQNETLKSEIIPVSKWRQAVPQILAVAAKNLYLMSLGCTLGFPTILIPKLQKADAEIEVTREELTWISSMNLILVPVGCLGSGITSDYLGRKKTIMLANGPFVCAWLIYHFAYNSTMLLCALAVTGLTGGLLEAAVSNYVTEITQPHLRGMLSATSATAVIIGVYTQILAGSLTTWRTVALMNIALPIICFAILFIVPESPHWLVGKGRSKEALKSLCWLRGWVKPDHVRDEYNSVSESFIQKREIFGSEKHWRNYTKRTFLVPFSIVCWVFIIANLGGTGALRTFAVSIFTELNAPIDKYTAAVLLGGAEIFGTLSCVILIHFTGKRKIGLFSTMTTGVCFFIVALYKFVIDRRLIVGDNYSWIPTYVLIAAAYVSHSGIKLLPWIMNGEVFCAEVRSGANAAAGSFGYICAFIENKVFLEMVDGITLVGTFWFYSAIGFVGSVVMYYILPETEGRTLREIEEHFAGIQNLNQPLKRKELPFEEEQTALDSTLAVTFHSDISNVTGAI